MPHKFDPAQAAKLLESGRYEWQSPERILDSLGLRRGEVLAVVGCGPGVFSVPAALRVAPGGRVYAVDISLDMLMQLGQRLYAEGLANVEKVLSKETNIPLPDGCADAALLANVLHEAEDPAALLAEARRLVRRGGRWRSAWPPSPSWRSPRRPGGGTEGRRMGATTTGVFSLGGRISALHVGLAAALAAALLLAGGCGARKHPAGAGAAPPSREAGSAPENGPGGTTQADAAAERLPGAVLVMIDNHPDARPQSGLQAADLVFEAVAEGGITRFLAVYQSRPADRIGPVRSARPYFVEIARGFNTLYAHAGGSDDAYRTLRRLGVPSLDEIRGGAGAGFWRDRSREAPHNLYTSTERLLAVAADLGREARMAPPLPLGDPGVGEPFEAVRITYTDTSDYKYITEYRPVLGEAGRARFEKRANGQPFFSDGKPVTADNVAILLTDVRQLGDAAGHVDVRVTGEGDALFLSHGRLFRGRWRKASPSDPFRFEAGGRPIPMAPGQTWINLAAPAQVEVVRPQPAQ